MWMWVWVSDDVCVGRRRHQKYWVFLGPYTKGSMIGTKLRISSPLPTFVEKPELYNCSRLVVATRAVLQIVWRDPSTSQSFMREPPSSATDERQYQLQEEKEKSVDRGEARCPELGVQAQPVGARRGMRRSLLR